MSAVCQDPSMGVLAAVRVWSPINWSVSPSSAALRSAAFFIEYTLYSRIRILLEFCGMYVTLIVIPEPYSFSSKYSCIV